MCLGWGLWMACSFTRNYRLYKRDVKREEPVGFVIHLCVFNFPWFLIVLVDQILFNTRYEDGENPFALKKDHCMYSEVPWEVHSLYLYMMFCLFLFISMRGRGYGNRFNDYYQINLCMILAALVWLVILFQIFTDTNFTPNGRLVKTTLVSPSARPPAHVRAWLRASSDTASPCGCVARSSRSRPGFPCAPTSCRSSNV